MILVVGEIGNNSFDHNIGNWPDVAGVFFGYNLKERKIILADRGQGILTTLKRVKKQMLTHKGALEVAFTEYVSGRAPESRGNGLKTVRKVIEGKTDKIIKNLSLSFQSGDAELFLKNDGGALDVKNVENFNKGCFALISY